jgi:hypothetical protein
VRALAVKLAAASAGGAVAVGTVKAASAGNTIATAATWSAAKIAGVIAIAGGIVTSAAVWRGSSHDAKPTQAPIHAQHAAEASETGAVATDEASPEVVQQAAPLAPVGARQAPNAPTGAASEAHETAVRGSEGRSANAAVNAANPSKGSSHALGHARESASKTTEARRSDSNARGKSAAAASPAPAKANELRTTASGTNVAPPSEVSLLRSAQVALAGRPREAFQLTQQHRRLYPAGEFAQERDALAIQALMRSGDTEQARDLAQAFIRAYPSSPHAHRFREAMGI